MTTPGAPPTGSASLDTATTARPKVTTVKHHRIHPAWIVAAVSLVALIGAAGFRSAPGVLMVPLQDEFGWSRGLLSIAVGVNLILYGLTAPFAAALMDRFGIRKVTSCALVLVALVPKSSPVLPFWLTRFNTLPLGAFKLMCRL